MGILFNAPLDLQVKTWLEEGKDIRLGDWKAADVEVLNTFQLLTAKPVVYLVSALLPFILAWHVSYLLIFVQLATLAHSLVNTVMKKIVFFALITLHRNILSFIELTLTC